MRRRCHTCLCRTCIRACEKCTDCGEKTEFCNQYLEFQQLSIFDSVKQYRPAPRASWDKYGLSDKERRKKLKKMCESWEYRTIVRCAAYEAAPEIAEYIIKSVTQNKSYDKLEFDQKLGRICVCKTDFYGYRRLFFSIFDRELREVKNEDSRALYL